MAKNLVNLEYIFLSRTDHIIPVLRHARKLKVIKIWDFDCLNENNFLDLETPNKQRQKLNGARKVSIGVFEEVYLSTKWETNDRNFSLVEIKRYELIDLNILANF